MTPPWPLRMFVPGHPRAYGSKVPMIAKHTRKAIVVEGNKKVGPWKKLVTAEMKAMLETEWAPHRDGDAPLIDRGQAVAVAFRFYVPTPADVRLVKKLEPFPTRKSGDYAGDWDKMARAVGDCGSDAGLWWDDCQIVSGLVQQRWADWGKHAGQPSGVAITFWPEMEG